jgi:hypothetical protein
MDVYERLRQSEQSLAPSLASASGKFATSLKSSAMVFVSLMLGMFLSSFSACAIVSSFAPQALTSVMNDGKPYCGAEQNSFHGFPKATSGFAMAGSWQWVRVAL